jgi:hypothetical protein
MTRVGLCAAAFASILASFLSLAPAHAQATRTWVSGVGDDANPCSRTAPCKTFAGAISKTHINGEINCIDPGGFGAVTITKSVTIDCWHVGGSILASGTTGIIVNIAPNANDPFRSVRIRGLAINGTGASGAMGTRTGIDGIRVLQAGSVFVEKTTIQDFSQEGIEVAASSVVNVVLDDVVVRNCGGSGVKLATASIAVLATLNEVRVHGCGVGFEAAGRTRVLVRQSVFSLDSIGIQTTGPENDVAGEQITLMRLNTAVFANAGAAIRLSDSIIVNSVTGLNPNGGSIISLGGNSVTNNGTNGAFSATVGKL